MAPWLCSQRTQKSMGAKSKGSWFYYYNHFTKLRFDECVPRECKKSMSASGRNLGEIWAQFSVSMIQEDINILVCAISHVAPGFKNKTRYTPYVSLGSQISHTTTNKGNINRQCSIYNVLSIKNITLDSKQWKDNSDLRVKTPIPQR